MADVVKNSTVKRAFKYNDLSVSQSIMVYTLGVALSAAVCVYYRRKSEKDN